MVLIQRSLCGNGMEMSSFLNALSISKRKSLLISSTRMYFFVKKKTEKSKELAPKFWKRTKGVG